MTVGDSGSFLITSSLDDYNVTFISSTTKIYSAIRGNNSSSSSVMALSGEIQVFIMIGNKLVYDFICANTSLNNVANCYIESYKK